MKRDWSITESKTGWSVFRKGRIVQYDCIDLDAAMRVVKRKAGKRVEVDVYDEFGHRSTERT